MLPGRISLTVTSLIIIQETKFLDCLPLKIKASSLRTMTESSLVGFKRPLQFYAASFKETRAGFF